jgi:hypothetical protein
VESQSFKFELIKMLIKVSLLGVQVYLPPFYVAHIKKHLFCEFKLAKISSTLWVIIKLLKTSHYHIVSQCFVLNLQCKTSQSLRPHQITAIFLEEFREQEVVKGKLYAEAYQVFVNQCDLWIIDDKN